VHESGFGTRRRLGNVRFCAACGGEADIDQRLPNCRRFMSTRPGTSHSRPVVRIALGYATARPNPDTAGAGIHGCVSWTPAIRAKRFSIAEGSANDPSWNPRPFDWGFISP
jgi:hypothetical protein